MKRKALTITAIVFFLIVNTNYFWESKLGYIAFPAFIVLTIVYLVLLAGLIGQIYASIKEKFNNRQRLFNIVLLLAVLGLTFLFPGGLINFEFLEGKDLLIAQREGSANCTTTFKLKQNNKFIERRICFGVTEIKGDYKIKDDTIFFSNVELGRDEDEFYAYAVFKELNSNNKKLLGELVRFKNYSDTTGHELWITKNELTSQP